MIRRTILYLKDIKQNKYYNILTVIENILDDIWGIERSGFFNGREKWAKDFENQRV